jgi:hypothetical protein
MLIYVLELICSPKNYQEIQELLPTSLSIENFTILNQDKFKYIQVFRALNKMSKKVIHMESHNTILTTLTKLSRLRT